MFDVYIYGPKSKQDWNTKYNGHLVSLLPSDAAEEEEAGLVPNLLDP